MVLTSAMNHGSKLSRNNRVEKIIRRKREPSFYGTADLGKSILNGVGSDGDSDVDRKIKGSPPHSPEMPRGGVLAVPGIARTSSLPSKIEVWYVLMYCCVSSSRRVVHIESSSSRV